MGWATASLPTEHANVGHARSPSQGDRLRRADKLFGLDRLGLTRRILAVNGIALALLAGSLFYLDSLRKQLVEERFKLARTQVEITAIALAASPPRARPTLLAKVADQQGLRLQLYDRQGQLELDSFALARPGFVLVNPAQEPWLQHAARALDRGVDLLVGADDVEQYRVTAAASAAAFPEIAEARAGHASSVRLRHAPDRTPVITAAAPVGTSGTMLLATGNPRDMTQLVRDARRTLAIVVAIAFLLSVQLSLFLARTIVKPIRKLMRAAVRVRLGRDREVIVPRLPERRDEIGLLARAISDMTAALRHRIDAVESFAADVSHELKNPLASLRSAVESLAKVDDPGLRATLTSIAAHDVNRIDRLISEIADASRIDAELSRARFERLDLYRLAERLVGERQRRSETRAQGVLVEVKGDPNAQVPGDAARLERLIENLVDNAVSFSPPGGRITVEVVEHGDRVLLSVSDQGRGIPPEERERVFERFHSVRPDEEDFGAHSGLGLAIARAIVEAHDGTLVIRDRPDGQRGACLVAELPAS